MFCSNHIANNINFVKWSEVLTIFPGIFSCGCSMEGSDQMVGVFFTMGSAARLAVWLAPGFRCHNYSRFYCALAAHTKGNLEGVKRKKEKEKRKKEKGKEKKGRKKEDT
jgi:hypothetical protein